MSIAYVAGRYLPHWSAAVPLAHKLSAYLAHAAAE
jgi:hypothetical protein